MFLYQRFFLLNQRDLLPADEKCKKIFTQSLYLTKSRHITSKHQLYAFDTGSSNIIFGMQPSTGDLTPGFIDLRIRCNSGTTVSQVCIEYDIWILNNGDRSSSLNLSNSLNGVDYTDVSLLDFCTLELADLSGWDSILMSTTISGLNVSDNDYFYLRWTTDDDAGLGARDEFGLDNISVSAIPVPAAVWLFGSGLIGLIGIARRKKS